MNSLVAYVKPACAQNLTKVEFEYANTTFSARELNEGKRRVANK